MRTLLVGSRLQSRSRPSKTCTTFSAVGRVQNGNTDKPLAAEVGDQVSTVGMACNVAFRAFAGILASKREHVTAMTAPISTNVRQRFEAMRNTVVDLLFVTFLQLE